MVFAEPLVDPDRDGMVARMTPSLYPLGGARDPDTIPPRGSFVNPEITCRPSDIWWFWSRASLQEVA